MKQTAVEWIVEQLEQKGDASVNVSIGRMQISIKEEDYIGLIKQGLEMEEQQSFDAQVDILSEQIVKEQERSYNEEDVKNAFLDGWQLRDGDLPFPKAKKKWFNEFKKE